MICFWVFVTLVISIQVCAAHIEGYVSTSSDSSEQQPVIYEANRLDGDSNLQYLVEAQLRRQDNERKGDEAEGLGIEIQKLQVAASGINVSTAKVRNLSALNATVSPNATLNARRFDKPKETPAPVLPPLHPRFRRIFNPDEMATVDDYPFVASLLMNRELWCGAAIIESDKVITAAHCLQLQYNNRFFREYVRMLTVRVGSTNATAGGEVYRVTDINFHPNYKPESLEFNLAILSLHRNITFGVTDPVVEKIDIKRSLTIPSNSNILFLGWGSALHRDGTGGQTLLQKVELPIYDIADCQEIYGKDLVTRNNFCAGYISIAKNVCNHDAGGPAIMDGELVGILSFSAARCDQPDYPAVFTYTGGMADWIDKYVGGKPIEKPHKYRQH